MNTTSTTLPENWNRAMAIVAHPDDLEYGAAGAVARWTRSGKAVAYVVATDGEAGIDGRTPAEAAPLRRREQLDAAAVVGVEDVTFLGYRDGVVEYGLDLRRAVAREIRRFRPDVLITATYEPTYGLDGGRIVNQADHRAVGLAVLDAARDAGNRWIFPELLDENLPPWNGVGHVYLMGANEPSHAVDVTESLDTGIESLRAHRSYLDGLGRDFDPAAFLREFTAAAGTRIGVRHAVAFQQIRLQGV